MPIISANPELLRIGPQEQHTILAGGVWDGISSQLLGPTVIQLKAGRIARLEHCPVESLQNRTLQQEQPTNADLMLDYAHLTLMPGLIDCHIHLALDGVGFSQATARWECPEALETQLAAELECYLAKGVLVVRDGGDRSGIALATAKAVKKGQLNGPLILASGQALTRKGKYGSFLGSGINSLQEAGEFIAHQAGLGVSQIKLVASGIVSFSEYGQVGALQFNSAELKFMVDYAHQLGLRVMAHASSEEAVHNCLQAGVDSIEHGYFLSTESLKAMAYQGTAWVPTVVPVANQVLKQNCRAGFTPSQVEVINRTYREHQEKLSLAHHLGVTIAIGTDAGASGVLHGQAHLEEMLLFAQAGLDKVTVLQAATCQAAKVLGLEKEYGTIAPGKLPCLLGVAVNPLENLDFIQAIRLVVLPG
ncbi:MAG: amidohydrolase family protein [Carboxydocellales bacterium]